MSADIFIGLMSGTSLDGVDAVAVRIPGASSPVQLLGHRHLPFDEPLRAALLRLNEPGPDEIHLLSLAANTIARRYAQAVSELLNATRLEAAQIRALGSHGQTVRHRPGEFDGTGYTVQLLNAALLAELTGIDLVCDFRSRDVAAGGQGAPLVPAFHAAVFGRPGESLAILNLGGIANITLLGPDGQVGGFDCGPGNVLLDLWCDRHVGTPYDNHGQWAAGGQVQRDLLTRMLDDTFIRRPPPKSTGRDHFHAQWLEQALGTAGYDLAHVPPQDVQSTLSQLTVEASVKAALDNLPGLTRLLVCGGGALNADLMSRLARRIPGVEVSSSASQGLDPMHVEATAFAWFAQRFFDRKPANCPGVTGAKGLRILGALYPA